MKPHEHILVLEDDALDALTLEQAFAATQVRNPVDILATGADALEYLYRNENDLPGLILLDLNLPGMSGLEFLRRIKNDAHLRRIPVVILSLSNLEQERQEAFELSAAGYFVKPMTYEAFVSMIQIMSAYWLLMESNHQH